MSGEEICQAETGGNRVDDVWGGSAEFERTTCKSCAGMRPGRFHAREVAFGRRKKNAPFEPGGLRKGELT